MIKLAEVLAALVSGKFKPFSVEDRNAFLDAGEDAMMWHPRVDTAVVVCTDEYDTMVIEIHNWEGDVWHASMLLKPLVS